MTPQEAQALEAFLSQLTLARAAAKDAQAEAMIAKAVAAQPDAAYLLVQRAMLLDHALAAAKQEIASLTTQLQTAQASGSTSFLEPKYAWGASVNPGAASPPAQAAAAQPAPTAIQPPQMPPAQQQRPGFLGGGLGGTLGSIATTAAGVAGGAFLFQGIENLFRHNSGNGFLGQSDIGTRPTETTVVNNYYGNENKPALDAPASTSDSGFLDAGLDDDDFTDDDSSIA
jgi:hypothetical protein